MLAGGSLFKNFAGFVGHIEKCGNFDFSGRPVTPEYHRGMTIIVNSANDVTKLWR